MLESLTVTLKVLLNRLMIEPQVSFVFAATRPSSTNNTKYTTSFLYCPTKMHSASHSLNSNLFKN